MVSIRERRRYPRFAAWLPLRLRAVAGRIEHGNAPLITQNISRAGVCFPAPQHIEPGHLIEVEVMLPGVGPTGADVPIKAEGYVVRAEPGNVPGWYKVAATFSVSPLTHEFGWQSLI